MDDQPPRKKALQDPIENPSKKKEPLPDFLPFLKKDDSDALAHYFKTQDISSAKNYFGENLSRLNSINPLCKAQIYKNLPDTFNLYSWQFREFDNLTETDLSFFDTKTNLEAAIAHQKTNLFENFIKKGITLQNLSFYLIQLALNSEFDIVMQCNTTERTEQFYLSLSNNELTCPTCGKLAVKLVVKKNSLAKCTHCFSALKNNEYFFPFRACIDCGKVNNTIYDSCFDCASLADPKISRNMQLFWTHDPEIVVDAVTDTDIKNAFAATMNHVQRMKDAFLTGNHDALQEAAASLRKQTNFFKNSIPPA